MDEHEFQDLLDEIAKRYRKMWEAGQERIAENERLHDENFALRERRDAAIHAGGVLAQSKQALLTKADALADAVAVGGRVTNHTIEYLVLALCAKLIGPTARDLTVLITEKKHL